ncbi:MAG: hypothetical protein AABX28_03295 [Nanoarchaeota archaeon]
MDKDRNRDYRLLSSTRLFNSEHTFYINITVIESWLGFLNGESVDRDSINFSCNGCRKKFKLTSEYYQKLINEMSEL